MSSSGVDPGCGGDFEAWFSMPDCTGHGEIWQRLLRLNDIHLVDDHPEAVSHIDQRGHNPRTIWRGEDQANRVCLAADPERMHLQRWSVRCKRRAHFEHVRSENLRDAFEIVGVVLHEGGATGK